MYKLIQGPASEPITIGEAKAWAKIEHSVDDSIITQLIIDAREYIEKFTSRALFTQTWDLSLDEMPSVLSLRITPLQSVTGIYYTDVDDIEWTEDDSLYFVDNYNHRVIEKQTGTYYGRTYVRDYNGWRIRFLAGETQYPAWSKRLCARVVAHMYDNRNVQDSPEIVAEILKYKVRYL